MAVIPPPHGFEARYQDIEAALAAISGVPASARATLKSWLGWMQRSGLLGESARIGRGLPLVYRVDQFRRLVVAMELAEAGWQPTGILRLISDHWDRLLPIFEAAEAVLDRDGGEAPGDSDIVLLLAATKFRSGALAVADPVSDIRYATMGELSKGMAVILRGADGDPAPRVLAINLTRRLAAFHDALIAAQRAKQEQQQPVAVRKLAR
jgi:hypothetical protein